MACANCEAGASPAYTLRVHVRDTEAEVDLRFCSDECLRAWV